MWGQNEFGDYILELKEDFKTFFQNWKFLIFDEFTAIFRRKNVKFHWKINDLKLQHDLLIRLPIQIVWSIGY